MLRLLLIAALLFTPCLEALRIHGPHSFFLGPEFYYLVRTRANGSRQEGEMGGINFKYERFKRRAFYWALEYDGGWGELDGHDPSGNSLQSNLNQQQLEVRGGYNFQWKAGKQPYILPFVGYGYFYQKNEIFPPHNVNLVDDFPYASIGIQLGFNPTCNLSIGLFAKADWMLEGNTRIENSPEFGTVKMNMEAEWQYDFELPITYRTNQCRRTFYCECTPFVKLRHFGGLPSVPFDFNETRYHAYGVKLLVAYDF